MTTRGGGGYTGWSGVGASSSDRQIWETLGGEDHRRAGNQKAQRIDIRDPISKGGGHMVQPAIYFLQCLVCGKFLTFLFFFNK